MDAKNKKRKATNASLPDVLTSPEQTNATAGPELPVALGGESKLFVVGIGASAGGLEAIESFFQHMDMTSGLAFVVVQHLSPDYKSLMVELLSKHTQMRIFSVKDGMIVEPNCIYLIPPKKNMTIFQGKLLLMDQERQRGLNLPIDVFFRSLAEDRGDYAVGVILSGTGSDGTLGIRAIKGAGGMVMVQDEASAKFDGMPKSAVSTGLVDYISSPDKMSEQLLKYTSHPVLVRGKKRDTQDMKEDDGLAKILATLRLRTGVDFTFYKPNTVIRRIERRMSVNAVESIQQYVSLIQSSLTEVTTLHKELLIGVTKFFRDHESFDVLKAKVIPTFFQGGSKNPIRVWTAGCSTGEEAYTLAILFQEFMEAMSISPNVKIFATDIDKESLEYAGAGLYPDSIAVDVSEERLRKYFRKIGNHYQVGKALRQMVVFAAHNITKDPPFSKIDLVTCRNMLIYLQPVMQQKVMTAFRFSLNQHGALFLGSSESVGELTNYFTTMDSKHKIYTCSNVSRPLNVHFFPQPSTRSQTTLLVRTDRSEGTGDHRDDNFSHLQEQLLNEFLPPSMIIDANHTLLHAFGDVNRYIRVPSGRINLNVLKMLPEQLSMPLGIALRKAFKDREKIVLSKVALKANEKTTYVTLTLTPTQDQKTHREFVLLVIEEWKGRPTKGPASGEVATLADHDQLRSLEQELQYSKQTLQATIEELESANEELQSTNEELVASNEELQSTNEELQSVNEELYTVNSEFQKKIEELSELNDDVNNWFNVTYIGTIFLDLKLCVRKFTPAVLPAINLIPSDIGRPITHISHNMTYEHFHADVEAVVATLQPRETEVRRKDGEWFLLKILPYRTIENAVKGIIITVINIDKQKRVEEQLARERELLLSVLENSPVGKILVDMHDTILFVNKRSCELLGLSPEKLVGTKFEESSLFLTLPDGTEIPREERSLVNLRATGRAFHSHIQQVRLPGGGYHLLSVNGSAIVDSEGNNAGAVLSIDIPHCGKHLNCFEAEPTHSRASSN